MNLQDIGLLDGALEFGEGVGGQRVVRFDVERLFEALLSAAEEFFGDIAAAEVVPGEMVGVVARGLRGLFEPGDGFVGEVFLEQVGADVVVGVTEGGVEEDGFLAFGDGVVEAALEAEGPAEEGMGFGGGVEFERAAVQINREI